MTTNEGRCEPPPGTEPHTHHWIGPAKGDVEPWLWADGAWWRGHQRYTPQEQAARGWVYDSPCTPPSTVAALVEALAWYALDYDHDKGCSQWDGGTKARQALALYRGEAGR